MANPSIEYARKGSQRWLQMTVNLKPELINLELQRVAKLPARANIEWLSPLAKEKFVEYRDEPTFDRLGVRLEARPLNEFWPARGPTWDGLARASTGDVFLVEAKAHIGEMVSGKSRASAKSKGRIIESLRAVQREIAPNTEEVDWSGTFYQYANRLAHLYFLRIENGVPAHLVFVYYLNAVDVKGPTTRAEYEGATKVIEHYLGLRQSKISKFVHKIYIDVNDLA